MGDLANKYNHRLVRKSTISVIFLFIYSVYQKTMHPGQFNQLVSLNPNVVTNTVRELDCKW